MLRNAHGRCPAPENLHDKRPHRGDSRPSRGLLFRDLGGRGDLQFPPSYIGPLLFHPEGSGEPDPRGDVPDAEPELRFKPQDGLAVLVYGELSVYERRGEYQIVVEYMEPKGLGALQLAFEQLKKKLAGRGAVRRGPKAADSDAAQADRRRSPLPLAQPSATSCTCFAAASPASMC